MEIQRKSESGFLGTNIVSEIPGFIKCTETRKEAIFFLFVACCYESEMLCYAGIVRDFRVYSW